ncbi:hypothetical protein A3Q56_04702 [Intoshia linei]|uniref:Uncharacterized protein n=1 Tax=Intoshia linei TaxID=1819745 RepID=A0A177B1P3_9BILA|nr:hypothetical protein A3Q56_04702 [Intoshia linei]
MPRIQDRGINHTDDQLFDRLKKKCKSKDLSKYGMPKKNTYPRTTTVSNMPKSNVQLISNIGLRSRNQIKYLKNCLSTTCTQFTILSDRKMSLPYGCFASKILVLSRPGQSEFAYVDFFKSIHLNKILECYNSKIIIKDIQFDKPPIQPDTSDRAVVDTKLLTNVIPVCKQNGNIENSNTIQLNGTTNRHILKEKISLNSDDSMSTSFSDILKNVNIHVQYHSTCLKVIGIPESCSMKMIKSFFDVFGNAYYSIEFYNDQTWGTIKFDDSKCLVKAYNYLVNMKMCQNIKKISETIYNHKVDVNYLLMKLYIGTPTIMLIQNLNNCNEELISIIFKPYNLIKCNVIPNDDSAFIHFKNFWSAYLAYMAKDSINEKNKINFEISFPFSKRNFKSLLNNCNAMSGVLNSMMVLNKTIIDELDILSV